MDSNPCRGFSNFLFLLFLITAVVLLYLGNIAYVEHYYIAFYDGEMVRYIDVPPFAKRITPASEELSGRFSSDIEVVAEQTNAFLKSICDRRGFTFRKGEKDNQFDIEIRPGYFVKGKYSGSKMHLVWNPILPESLKAKVESNPESGKIASPTEARKK